MYALLLTFKIHFTSMFTSMFWTPSTLVSSLTCIINKATSQHNERLIGFSSCWRSKEQKQHSKFPLHVHGVYLDPADLYNKPIIVLGVPKGNTQATWATYGKTRSGPEKRQVTGRTKGAEEKNNNPSMRPKAPTSKQTDMHLSRALVGNKAPHSYPLCQKAVVRLDQSDLSISLLSLWNALVGRAWSPNMSSEDELLFSLLHALAPLRLLY